MVQQFATRPRVFTSYLELNHEMLGYISKTNTALDDLLSQPTQSSCSAVYEQLYLDQSVTDSVGGVDNGSTLVSRGDRFPI